LRTARLKGSQFEKGQLLSIQDVPIMEVFNSVSFVNLYELLTHMIMRDDNPLTERLAIQAEWSVHKSAPSAASTPQSQLVTHRPVKAIKGQTLKLLTLLELQ